MAGSKVRVHKQDLAIGIIISTIAQKLICFLACVLLA